MIFKDYYKILELESNQVSAEEIKQAYREQAKKHHPDINTSNSFSEERFKDINEAYKVLSNPASKRKYDRMWNSHVGRKKYKNEPKEKKSLIAEIFQMFLGETNTKTGEEKSKKTKNKKVPAKGENVQTEITISIFDAFYGTEKEIVLRALDGKMKKFSVKIPAGIRNEEKIRIIGQGKPGINGGNPGDLLIKVHIANDKKYKLVGFDLYTNLLITPWEAVLGTKVKLTSVDEEISLYIPKGTQTGDNIRIAGKGYLNGKGGRGDLIANIQIMVPKNVTEEEKKLFEQLKEKSKYNPR